MPRNGYQAGLIRRLVNRGLSIEEAEDIADYQGDSGEDLHAGWADEESIPDLHSLGRRNALRPEEPEPRWGEDERSSTREDTPAHEAWPPSAAQVPVPSPLQDMIVDGKFSQVVAPSQQLSSRARPASAPAWGRRTHNVAAGRRSGAYSSPSTVPVSTSANREMSSQVGFERSLERVRKQIFRRRIRTRELFQDFDGRNSGRVTRDQFFRVLSRIYAPFQFHDKENGIDPDALADHYATRLVHPASKPLSDDIHVLYTDFCNDVDTVFVTPNLEKQPCLEVPPPGFGVIDTEGFQPRAVEDTEGYEALLQRIAILCDARGIDARDCFGHIHARPPADVNAGRILTSDFLRYFPLLMTSPISPAAFTHEEIAPIMQRFTDDYGYFRLMYFQEELDKVLSDGIEHPMISVLPPYREIRPRDTKVHNESRGFSLSAQHRRPQSARAASTGRGPGERQGDLWAESRAASTQRPQTAGIIRGMEARPNLPRRPVTARPTISGPQRDVLMHVKRQAAVRRLRLEDAFRDFDKARRGVCSASGFKNGLTALGITLTEEELREIAEKYSTPEGDFCYIEFCNEAEGTLWQETRKAEVQRIGIDRVPPRVREEDPKDSAANILLSPEEQARVERAQEIIAKQVKLQGIGIYDIFHSFARSHIATQSHVTVLQYIKAMDTLRIKAVPKDDVALLCKAYCDTLQGDEFNYVDFCAAVDPLNSRPSTNKAVQKFAQKMNGAGSRFTANTRSLYYDIQGKVTQCAAPARCRPPPHSARARRPGRCFLPSRPLHMTG